MLTDNCNTGYDNTTQLVEYVTVPRASANDAFGNRSESNVHLYTVISKLTL